MNVSIREIRSEDLASVISLLREFAAFENLSDFCDVSEERLRAAMFGPAAVVEGLIAFERDSAIAYALFYPNFSSFRGQRGLYLEDIYVKPEYRGKGLGESMLKKIAAIAVARGCERIDFLVLDWNTTAANFYQGLGAVGDAEERHFKFTDRAFHALSS